MSDTEPLFDPVPKTYAGRLCAWCGETAVAHVELEKARFTTDKLTGVRLMAKRALTAPVCEHHQRSLRFVEGREPMVDTDGGVQR